LVRTNRERLGLVTLMVRLDIGKQAKYRGKLHVSFTFLRAKRESHIALDRLGWESLMTPRIRYYHVEPRTQRFNPANKQNKNESRGLR
jgi:hypothetical protein